MNRFVILKYHPEASPLAQLQTIHLPVQETRVWSLIREGPHVSEQLSLSTTAPDLVL